MGGGRQTPECVPDISIQISNLLKMFLETSISKMVDNNTQPFFFFLFVSYYYYYYYFVNSGRRDLESGSRAKVNNLLIETS